MRNLLGTLRLEDRFNVLLFASGNFKLSPDALPATKDNIDKGIRLVEQQRGGGGTQLLPALQEALATKNAEGYARTVVIATDGYITVDHEAIDHIHKHLGEAQLLHLRHWQQCEPLSARRHGQGWQGRGICAHQCARGQGGRQALSGTISLHQCSQASRCSWTG
jgi:hypothetical protein